MDLYTDDDPDYRATKVSSGIPPPSAWPRQQRYHHNRFQHQQQASVPASNSPGGPPPQTATPVDMRTSTDFLQCQHRLTVAQIVSHLEIADVKLGDSDWCQQDLLNQTKELRTRIQATSNEEFSLARARSNPFSAIGKSIFMNRAATKLAALDATFALTATQQGKTFVFADVCGGPGGFSEYLLWRIHGGGGLAKGYGITLKVGNDQDYLNWHTEKFGQQVPRDFTQIDGVDGTGNLYNEDNMKAFGDAILKATHGQGADLVVADGGFDFSGQEDKQERTARRLILCEIITMFMCLRQGGAFVCKFFDITEDFTVQLLWILYQLFDMICITKPLTSRPANSERYLVCRGLRVGQPVDLIEALLKVNRTMDRGQQVNSFVRDSFLKADEDFVDYVKMRNIRFAVKQINALECLIKYIHDPYLAPMHDLESVRRQCLSEWRLPLHRNSD